MPPVPHPWFPLRQPNPHARLRVFGLPYAGGGASIYNGWTTALPAGIEWVSVQLPGRERRILEKPFQQLPPLLDALEEALAPLLDKPFVFFGYSMGTRIALGLAQRWQARGAPLPLGMVMAAAGAPHRSRESRGALSDAEFIELLRKYEGTPAEIFAHKELLDMVLPTLRADFAIADAVMPALPVRCPISVYGGLEDPYVTLSMLEPWSELTTGEFRTRSFPGKHFFLRTAREPLLNALREELVRWAPDVGP
ncbi:microcystin synthetase associated thioesterase [Cystobacter fuscus DSM 2262]|uniref:Microcystin synthetase associated thioesterase n=1 Tax=Cystobacter fuscus (strain ATCC 25194 / DSM 2262 / NBRC 100088 / M29) TaxID=1242864 RepID=S9NV51_CYSF2|nr:thioesterase domain-containing protein [Cystobacter fuscus]EPX56040.1 microcystin synthetase associated thioesterase [Cystobacter fuscus DSM 2262]